MEANELFVVATREKYRFDTPQGQLTAEDLFDLPLQTTRAGRASLDDIAIALNKQIKDVGTVSFVDDAPVGNAEREAKLAIVVFVIEFKKAEKKAKETKAANAEKKQQILAIMAGKETEVLSGKSMEELQTLLATL